MNDSRWGKSTTGAHSPPAARKRRAFTLVELLVVIAIIGILVALLLPAIQAAREAARRAQCANNIKNVALAVLNYESSKKVLPEGMTFDPALAGSINTLTRFGPNWIIKILPQMEEQALYDSFDFSVGINQAGSDNRNIEARGTVISSLMCPSDGYNQVKYEAPRGAPHGGNWARGNYAASAGRAFLFPAHMTGPDSNAWSNSDWSKGDTLYCKRGVMGPNASVMLKQITDGTSKTIMVAEIRAGPTPQDARGVWALGHAGASLVAMYGSGGDDNGPNFGDVNADDVYSDICGGTDEGTTLEMAELMPCFDGNVFDQATARSKHPGGVHIALCDASVQFISDDIETSGFPGQCCTVWDWMITSADSGAFGGYQGVQRGNICK